MSLFQFIVEAIRFCIKYNASRIILMKNIKIKCNFIDELFCKNPKPYKLLRKHGICVHIHWMHYNMVNVPFYYHYTGDGLDKSWKWM